MKSYLIFSDIHGDTASLSQLKRSAGEFDGVFFAGDGLNGVKNQFEGKEFYAVKGNCDSAGEEELLVEIDGVKILLTHGHLYGVKSSYLRILMRARELGAKAVIFGHTHFPTIIEEDGVLLINPGSCSYYSNIKNYAIMFIANNKVNAYLNQMP